MVTLPVPTQKFHLNYNTAALIVATSLLLFGLVLYIAFEILTHSMFYRLWITAGFAAFFGVPALVLLWNQPPRVKLALISTFLLLILVTRTIDWNSRKPFLRALDSVQPGMTAAQVDAAMGTFMRFPRVGVTEQGSVGYRHTEEGWGNADIGLVTFDGGRVVKVEYFPD
jgi:hypothetical protein